MKLLLLALLVIVVAGCADTTAPPVPADLHDCSMEECRAKGICGSTKACPNCDGNMTCYKEWPHVPYPCSSFCPNCRPFPDDPI